MRKEIIIIIIAIASIRTLGQTVPLKYPIYLDISHGYLIEGINMIDSLGSFDFTTEKNVSIKIFNNNGKGTFKFLYLDLNKNITIKGQYLGAGTLKNEIPNTTWTRRVTTKKSLSTTLKGYYQPLRNGDWYYYRGKDEFVKLEKYKKGKLYKIYYFKDLIK